MKLLADENIDPAIIDWLRAEQHDVFSARESTRGAEDRFLAELADLEGRVVVTRDKDFGELVYRLALSIPGVVLLRYQSTTRQESINTFIRQWPLILPRIPGYFVVVTDKALRVRPV